MLLRLCYWLAVVSLLVSVLLVEQLQVQDRWLEVLDASGLQLPMVGPGKEVTWKASFSLLTTSVTNVNVVAVSCPCYSVELSEASLAPGDALRATVTGIAPFRGRIDGWFAIGGTSDGEKLDVVRLRFFCIAGAHGGVHFAPATLLLPRDHSHPVELPVDLYLQAPEGASTPVGQAVGPTLRFSHPSFALRSDEVWKAVVGGGAQARGVLVVRPSTDGEAPIPDAVGVGLAGSRGELPLRLGVRRR